MVRILGRAVGDLIASAVVRSEVGVSLVEVFKTIVIPALAVHILLLHFHVIRGAAHTLI